MSTEVLTIVVQSAEEATAILQKAFDGAFADDQSVLFRFDGWPNFHLNVKGGRYSATIPTQLMRSLIDYQKTFNKAYAQAIYNSSAKSFTDEDKASNELLFKVSEGSSDFFANLAENLNGFSEKMVEKMTGRQLVFTVLGLALLSTGYFGYKNYLDHDSAMAAEQGRQRMQQALIESNEASRRASEDFAQNALVIVRSVVDADSVDVGTQHFDRGQIQAVAQKSRDTWVKRRIDGDYRVTSLKKLKDRWAIQLEREDDGQVVRTDLYRSEIGARAIQEISTAFASDKPLKLYIIAGVKGDQVAQARILGTKSTGLGVAHTVAVAQVAEPIKIERSPD